MIFDGATIWIINKVIIFIILIIFIVDRVIIYLLMIVFRVDRVMFWIGEFDFPCDIGFRIVEVFVIGDLCSSNTYWTMIVSFILWLF